ncbi:MAG: D-alanine--D-alanine ligase [Planctomycetaceae bacterium]
MLAAILYQQVAITDSAADLDVLRQVSAVEDSLYRLGWKSIRVPFSLDLRPSRSSLIQAAPDVVFNLVETLAATDRLMPLATILLESLDLPFTGAGTRSLLATTHKLAAKQQMAAAQLPTPAWLDRSRTHWQGLSTPARRPQRAVVKAVCEHASLGLADDSVVPLQDASAALLTELLADRTERYGTPFFAEEYIEGREFNLSLLAENGLPIVLPPAEIQFLDFPPEKPRIVGYAAKWDEAAAEYRQTPRTFRFPAADRPLLDELQALARRCWTEFELHGYARVDFRVDEDGQPWILEINVNPCLSPDAGFAAALAEQKLTLDAAVQRIIEDAFR